MKLNLGCSDRPVEGFIGVDIAPGPAVDQVVDLEGPWPWTDSSVTEVRAYDVFEHIGDCSHMMPRVGCVQCYYERKSILHELQRNNPAVETYLQQRHTLGRIHCMNELHRVLVPGGIATIEVPDAAKGAGFFQDPTHKTPWTRNSFQYFGAGPGGDFAHGRLAKSYGITAKFELVSMEHRQYTDAYDVVWKIVAVLKAVK